MSADPSYALGVDIGGTGMKAAIVDLDAGVMASDRRRIKTPRPATLDALSDVFTALIEFHEWTGPVGCTFPGVVRNNIIDTAVNLDSSWVGVDIGRQFGGIAGGDLVALNDADAAGLAEMRYGAGRDQRGVVAMITLGTGIGTAIFVDGHLVPNTELGHIEMGGVDAELQAAARVKDDEELSWEVWGRRVSRYLETLEALLWPELIIVGGGVSKTFDSFAPFLDVRTPVVPAQLRNHAGIIGAAAAVALT